MGGGAQPYFHVMMVMMKITISSYIFIWSLHQSSVAAAVVVLLLPMYIITTTEDKDVSMFYSSKGNQFDHLSTSNYQQPIPTTVGCALGYESDFGYLMISQPI